jgi:hypothetical protein
MLGNRGALFPIHLQLSSSQPIKACSCGRTHVMMLDFVMLLSKVGNTLFTYSQSMIDNSVKRSWHTIRVAKVDCDEFDNKIVANSLIFLNRTLNNLDTSPKSYAS